MDLWKVVLQCICTQNLQRALPKRAGPFPNDAGADRPSTVSLVSFAQNPLECKFPLVQSRRANFINNTKCIPPYEAPHDGNIVSHMMYKPNSRKINRCHSAKCATRKWEFWYWKSPLHLLHVLINWYQSCRSRCPTLTRANWEDWCWDDTPPI